MAAGDGAVLFRDVLAAPERYVQRVWARNGLMTSHHKKTPKTVARRAESSRVAMKDTARHTMPTAQKNSGTQIQPVVRFRSVSFSITE